MTGNKAQDKTYFRHVNGRPGSYHIESFNQLQQVCDCSSRLLVCPARISALHQHLSPSRSAC